MQRGVLERVPPVGKWQTARRSGICAAPGEDSLHLRGHANSRKSRQKSANEGGRSIVYHTTWYYKSAEVNCRTILVNSSQTLFAISFSCLQLN